jgi:hypothetical protein
MANALLYFLLIVGVLGAAAGYALSHFPSMFDDEARQAFWRAIGTYVWLLGIVAAIFSAYFLYA